MELSSTGTSGQLRGPTSGFSLLRGEGAWIGVSKSQCWRTAPAVKSLRHLTGQSMLQQPEKALKPKMQVEVAGAGVNRDGGVGGADCAGCIDSK